MHNPLRDRKIQLVIFGATGRLTTHKIIPALYKLYINKKFPSQMVIWGVGRREWSDKDFQNFLEDELTKNPKLQLNKESWARFSSSLRFLEGDLEEKSTYEQLFQKIKRIDQDQDQEDQTVKSEKLFYLAVDSSLYKKVIENISEIELNKYCKRESSKILIEKPFGSGVESASQLQQLFNTLFTEKKIYRMNHSFSQDIINLLNEVRVSNPIIQDLMSSSQLDHIQVTHFETSGIEQRGEYYERNGAARDLLQSQLLEIIAELLYDIDIKDKEKAKLDFIKSLEPIEKEELIAGQYNKGMLEGKLVAAYRSEAGIERESNSPTYIAFKTGIRDLNRKITPLYIRTGKRMKSKVTEIIFVLKRESLDLVNLLSVRVYPYPGIYITMSKKNKNSPNVLEKIVMEHTLKLTDKKQLEKDEVYDKYLYKALASKREEFANYDQIIESWRLSDQVNIEIESGHINVYPYPAGTWGPEKAKQLIINKKFRWYTEEHINVCKQQA